jgi:hypothetical protein
MIFANFTALYRKLNKNKSFRENPEVFYRELGTEKLKYFPTLKKNFTTSQQFADISDDEKKNLKICNYQKKQFMRSAYLT